MDVLRAEEIVRTGLGGEAADLTDQMGEEDIQHCAAVFLDLTRSALERKTPNIEDQETLYKALDRLDQQDQFLLAMLWGLEGEASYRLTEVSAQQAQSLFSHSFALSTRQQLRLSETHIETASLVKLALNRQPFLRSALTTSKLSSLPRYIWHFNHKHPGVEPGVEIIDRRIKLNFFVIKRTKSGRHLMPLTPKVQAAFSAFDVEVSGDDEACELSMPYNETSYKALFQAYIEWMQSEGDAYKHFSRTAGLRISLGVEYTLQYPGDQLDFKAPEKDIEENDEATDYKQDLDGVHIIGKDLKKYIADTIHGHGATTVECTNSVTWNVATKGTDDPIEIEALAQLLNVPLDVLQRQQERAISNLKVEIENLNVIQPAN
jgi:hypothetical protein